MFRTVSGRPKERKESATLGSGGSVRDAAVDLQFSGFVVVAQVCYEAVCWPDTERDEKRKSEMILVVFVSVVRFSGGFGEFRARLKAVVDSLVALQGSQKHSSEASKTTSIGLANVVTYAKIGKIKIRRACSWRGLTTRLETQGLEDCPQPQATEKTQEYLMWTESSSNGSSSNVRVYFIHASKLRSACWKSYIQ